MEQFNQLSWLLFAVGAAFLTGLSVLLAKCGLKRVDAVVATALRTLAVVIVAGFFTVHTGAQAGILHMSGRALLTLLLAGLVTGGSWLCFHWALKAGGMTQVVPLGALSTVVTLTASFFLLHQALSVGAWISLAVLLVGVVLMTYCCKTGSGWNWLMFGLLSVVLTSASALIVAWGAAEVDESLSFTLRAIVALVTAGLLVLATGKHGQVSAVSLGDMTLLTLSALSGGGAWLCAQRALVMGDVRFAPPILELDVAFAVLLAFVFLRERVSRWGLLGLLLLTGGAVALTFF